MALLTFREYEPDAEEAAPFANGTEGELWMSEHCERCTFGDEEANCPLILLAMIGRTPRVWTRVENAGPCHTWHCPEWTPIP